MSKSIIGGWSSREADDIITYVFWQAGVVERGPEHLVTGSAAPDDSLERPASSGTGQGEKEDSEEDSEEEIQAEDGGEEKLSEEEEFNAYLKNYANSLNHQVKVMELDFLPIFICTKKKYPL